MGPQGTQGFAGRQGPQGIQGSEGPRGIQGNTGPTGAAGIIGATGPAGPTGPRGDLGPTGPTGPEGPIPDAIFASFVNYAAQFTNASLIPMGIGVSDPTGSIVLTDPTRITLAPGVYSISYEVSALLQTSSYMQITPYYNGSPHIEYGIYFMTGEGRSSAFGSVSFIIEAPTETVFNLTYNSGVTGIDGTLTMVIFKLRRGT